MPREISCDSAISEISECLCQADGDFITGIYRDVLGRRATYIGDNILSVEEPESDVPDDPLVTPSRVPGIQFRLTRIDKKGCHAHLGIHVTNQLPRPGDAFIAADVEGLEYKAIVDHLVFDNRGGRHIEAVCKKVEMITDGGVSIED